MVTTNIVRKVDRVGRVSLPLSLRESLGFAKQDPLIMYEDCNRIVVQRYVPACFFCSGGEDLKTFRSFLLCRDCRAELREKAAAVF